MSSMRLIVWNVGAGNSITCFTPNGKILQFDIGSSQDCSPLTELAKSFSTKVIDTLVITHPHGDHLRDIGAFKSCGITVKSILRPKHLTDAEIKAANGENDDACVTQYLDLFKNYTDAVKTAESSLAKENNGGVVVRHFHPQNSAHSNINNHSIVTFLSYDGTKILVPGDCESAGWNELLKDDDFKKELKGVTVLIAPHHGHANGYSSDVMKEIKPTLELVIVSDGKYNEKDSVTQYYSAMSKGHLVKNATTKETKLAYCVTTRNNGWVDMVINSSGAAITVSKGA